MHLVLDYINVLVLYNNVTGFVPSTQVIQTLSPLDPGISRGVTDLYPSRGYTHPVTRAVEVSHAACKAEF